MPSGSKKRKAAAKKKDINKASTLHSATTSQDHDDPQIVEGGDGAVISPVSDDRQNTQELGLIEEKRDPLPVRSIAAENVSEEVVYDEGDGAQKVVEEEDGGGVIADRELNTEQVSESKNGSVEHIDSLKKSHSRSSSSSSGSSRSSSSSEDDDPQVVEKKSLASESEKLNNGGASLVTEGTDVSDNVPSEETHYNSITESEPIVDSIQFVEPVLEKVIPLTETEKDDNVSENEPNEEAHYNSVMETELIVDSIKLDEPVLEKVIPLTETLTNSNLADLGTDEKDEPLLPSLDETENTRVAGTVVGIKSENNENYGGSSSANAPFTGTGTGEKDVIVSEIPECSENQPLIATALAPVQKTSWKSCCGLFDVLTRTNDR